VKITEIAASRRHILKLKCTKFDLSWGSTPNPSGGAYSTPPDLVAGFQEAIYIGEGRGEDGMEWE